MPWANRSTGAVEREPAGDHPPGAIAERGNVSRRESSAAVMAYRKFPGSKAPASSCCSPATRRTVPHERTRATEATAPTPLSRAVARSLASSVAELRKAGASVVERGAVMTWTGISTRQHAAASRRRAVPPRAACAADRGVRQRVARRRRARRAGSGAGARAARGQPYGEHLLDARGADEAYGSSSPCPHACSLVAAEPRQRADWCRRERGDESWRPLSVDGAPGFTAVGIPASPPVLPRCSRTTTCGVSQRSWTQNRRAGRGD